MTTSKSNQAGPSAATQAANEQAIEFDTLVAHELLTRMASTDDAGKEAKTERDNASLEFCRFARTVEQANDGVERGTITTGFAKHLDSMRPMLAAEGNTFVDAKSVEGKDTVYAWRGHGANVKSIAKGVTEFDGILHDDNPAIIDVAEAESFTEVKKSVEQARRWGEDIEAALLRNSKEALREACAALISSVIQSNDTELIDLETLAVETQLADWNESVAEQDALDAEANDDEADETDITIPSDDAMSDEADEEQQVAEG